MSIKLSISILFTALFSSTLSTGQSVTNLGNGKIKVITKVDGVNREYFIHTYLLNMIVVKRSHSFMLHGTGADGEAYYNAYGWTELGDIEGFISVFPSSGRYKINDNGEPKTITKWNTQPDADWTFNPEKNRLDDDIKFLRQVMDEVRSSFKIDAKESI